MPSVVRIKGDRAVTISAQLRRKVGTTIEDVDRTGETVEFSMVDSEGVDKVAQTPATIDDADAAGGAQVSYAFLAADVDTVGTFYAYFHRVNTSGNLETFPGAPRTLVVEVKDK